VENQAYMVSVNATGPFMANLSYGNSMVIDPEGRLVWEAGENPCNAVITLDLDEVQRTRQYGSFHMDHYLQHLRDYDFPMPYAGKTAEAPVFKGIGSTSQDIDLYIKAREEINM